MFAKPILFVCLFFSFSFLSHSKEFPYPFSLSVSGSGGASLSEDFSYLINPALLAFHQRNIMGLAYSFKNKEQSLALSVVDNKNKWPMAVTYQRLWSGAFHKGGKNQFFFSSGSRLTNYLSLGFQLERDLDSSFNANIGSFLKLSSQLGFALFLDKILREREVNLRVLTFSASYHWKDFFSLHSDLSRSAKKDWILKMGMESLFHPLFSFQLGGMVFMENLAIEKGEDYLLSGGLSFFSPKFVLNYGIQTDAKNYQHSISCLIKI